MTLVALRFVVPFLLAIGVSAQSVPMFSAMLDGGQVVPPTTSPAAAWAVVQLAGSGQLRVTIDVDGLPTAANCELRHGAPGQNGALILALTGGPKTFVGATNLAVADAQAVAAGATHVVVGTPAYPAGEIRGQVQRPRAQRFVAELLPQNLVPPMTYPVQGSFSAHLHEPDDRLIVSFGTVAGATSVHYELRAGGVGQNGALLHTWNSQSSQGHTYGESRKLSAAEVQALRAGDLYVESKALYPFPYNTLNPTARGQLRPIGNAWAGTLTAGAVVPPSAATVQNVAGCHCTVLGNEWRFFAARSSGDTACHLRHATAGNNGPIVFSLIPYGGQPLWYGTRLLTPTELSWLENGELYLETVTAAMPSHTRAQITLAIAPGVSWGSGCRDGSGTLWHLVERSGIPAVGSYWPVNDYVLHLVAHGLRPVGGLGYLLVGFQRDAFGATSLPMRLDGYGGSPDCYLFTDIAVVVPGNAGAVEFRLRIPPDQGLRGLSMFGQGVMFDPAATGFFAVSNGLELTVR